MSEQRSEGTILNDGQQYFSWEWAWETEDMDTYSDFNFHDYSKPYQEMETLCGSQGEDLRSVEWLLDFKIPNYFPENTKTEISFPLQKLHERTVSQLPLCSSAEPASDHTSDQNVTAKTQTESIWKTCTSTEKPPYNYNELIEQALLDKGKLTVDDIYQWIASRFPYYKLKDPQWKGCIRHRLSVNKAFVKVEKVGKCHLWTYQEHERTKPATATCTMKHIKNHWKKQKLAELEIANKQIESIENTPTRPMAKKKVEAKLGKNGDKARVPLREIFVNTKKHNIKLKVRPTCDHRTLQTPELTTIDASPLQLKCSPASSPDILGFHMTSNVTSNVSVPEQEEERIFSPLEKEDRPALPMQMDMNSCRVLSTKTLPPNISALLDADSSKSEYIYVFIRLIAK
ncbi:forkhead box protein C2-B-like [Lineus longissimus]|uniref:forkhead box protein C2-B-like n=1 Tax=Lineus longissimus TaxID=88925 RepID=UPI00315C83E2